MSEEVLVKSTKFRYHLRELVANWLWTKSTEAATNAFTRWEANQHWTIKISKDEETFRVVLGWIYDNAPDLSDVFRTYEQEGLRARVQPAGSGTRTGALSKRVYFVAEQDDYVAVNIEGHRFRVKVAKSEKPTAVNEGSTIAGANISFYAPKPILQLSFSSKEDCLWAQNRIAELVDEWENKASEKTTVVKVYGRYDWMSRRRPLRPLTSVVLPGEVRSETLEDLKKFLNSEDLYVSKAVPWHRGYLFHGEPGTGKSSFAHALASETGLETYVLDLSTTREKFDEAIAEMSMPAILLLEDIDTAEAAHDRTAEEGQHFFESTKELFSKLANVLDGPNSPHGMVVIATTNHIEKLDPAIIREGRFDVHVAFDFVTVEQVNEMFEFFYGEELGVPLSSTKLASVVSTSIASVLKNNFENPEVARQILKERYGL